MTHCKGPHVAQALPPDRLIIFIIVLILQLKKIKFRDFSDII